MREKIETFSNLNLTLENLYNNGLLLMSGESGNPMTIGWERWNRLV